MRFVRSRFGQLLRYSAVSVISTVTSMIILGVLVATNSMPAGWANVVATAVGTIPSFELNRRWVWNRTGDRRIGAEVVPFIALSFAGLGLSTLAVHYADLYVRHSGWSNGSRTLAVEVASNAAFGVLWVLQFVILDRMLFRTHPRTAVSASTADLPTTSVAAAATSVAAAGVGAAALDGAGLDAAALEPADAVGGSCGPRLAGDDALVAA